MSNRTTTDISWDKNWPLIHLSNLGLRCKYGQSDGGIIITFEVTKG